MSLTACVSPDIDKESAAGYLSFCDAYFYRKKKSGWKREDALIYAQDALIADTHTHLDMLTWPALSLARAHVCGVGLINTIVDPTEYAHYNFDSFTSWMSDAHNIVTGWAQDIQCSDYDRARKASLRAMPRLVASAGVHPHNASQFNAVVKEQLISLLRHKRCCCVGEVGLDYYYDHSPRDVQARVFEEQIDLACSYDIPLMLHIRDAHSDALSILKNASRPRTIILHCCTLCPEEIVPWIELDCYIAFGGAITFASSDHIREALRLVPYNRLLTETDAPFMTPAPLRGVENGPEFVSIIAPYIAELVCEHGTEHALLHELYENAYRALCVTPAFDA